MPKLQDASLNRSQYDRPTQQWQCGHAQGCHTGPNAKGHCRASYQCHPEQRNGEWYCSRKDCLGVADSCSEGPLANGVCAHPEPSCVPVRSLRAKRSLVTRWLVSLTIGLLVLLIAGNTDHNVFSKQMMGFISPGDVLPPHETFTDGCVDCHMVVHQGPLEWASKVLGRDASMDDSKLCLTCHDLGKFKTDPHTRDPEQLAKISKAISQITGKPVPEKTWGALACATCHQEHQSSKHDLSALTDEQCQTCHSRTFESFTEGHPEYKSRFPRSVVVTQAEKTIRYNHREEKHAKKDCSQCHALDAEGVTMWPESFYPTCTEGCHGKNEGKIANIANLAALKFRDKTKKDLKTLARKFCANEDGCQTTERTIFHADGLLTRWYEAALQPTNEKACKTASEFFDFLYGDTADTPADQRRVHQFDKQPDKRPAAAACIHCHVADPKTLPTAETCAAIVAENQDRAAQATYPWRVQRPVAEQEALIHFKHAPHRAYSNESEKGCQVCHELTENTPENVYDFKPIKKGTCMQCHHDDANNDGCLVCHNYHVGRVGLVHSPKGNQ